ncbi:YiiD C-terminal domain-containing protein [Maricurvus nonylphenolicus]|uniref:YiiD C-terminal domain-containing protein n=1 Tax=Maricurvus nonylphenolicus TaxID=1008307 RepID=UPI0036F40B8A
MTINMTQMMQQMPTIERMNCKVIEESVNRCVIEMPLEGNSNHVGTAYAGAMFTLAEFPFGLMFLSRFGGMDKLYPVVGEMNIRYMAPAMTAVRLTVEISEEQWQQIETETLEKGKYKIVLPLELQDANGTVVAKTEATYFSIKS